MPPRVLCDVAQGPQRCMAPLMHLEGDKIVEASLLWPMGNGLRKSPTLVKEAVLLGGEPELQEAQEAAALPCEHLEETLKPKDTIE